MFRYPTQFLRRVLFAIMAISLVMLPVSGAIAAPTMSSANMEEMAPCPEKQSCCEKDMTDCANPAMCVSPGSACLDIIPVQLDSRFNFIEVTFSRYEERLTSLELVPLRRPPRI